MAEEIKTTTKDEKGEAPSYGGAYGKKSSMPMWAWILIYLVIGGIIYYAVYALYFAKKDGAYNASATTDSGVYTPPTGGIYGN
ncbi:MAG: hypothetical protein AAB701_02645 [Patescibacteria group bacterium]